MADDQNRSDQQLAESGDGGQSGDDQARANRVAELLAQGRDLSRRVEEDLRTVVNVGEADVRLRLR